MKKYVVGVDLGGTNVRAAVVDSEERITGQARNPSNAKLGAAQVIRSTSETVKQAAADGGIKVADIAAVGMAVPGHIDSKRGMIIWSPNFGESVDGRFRMFMDVAFSGPVCEALGVRTVMGNDANLAALGEFRYGAGRDVDDMVMFTLGTGIGSGVICDGRLIIGATGGAVELGHHAIVANGRQCGCGWFGCMEAYCGTSAILERAQRAIATGAKTMLAEKAGRHGSELTPKVIDECAQAGDAVAQEVLEETGRYLGVGIGNAVNIFNPALVVIGGGIRKATGLLEAARRSMQTRAVDSMVKACRLVEAELGDDAGVMGAAELAWRHVLERG